MDRSWRLTRGDLPRVLGTLGVVVLIMGSAMSAVTMVDAWAVGSHVLNLLMGPA